MKNEIGRKITSLTLMTIMLVGITAAFPSAMPEAAAANQYLFVSAENSVHGNMFYGPQVVEVVVNDSDINRTDVATGQPDVTVNGKKMIMAQGSDGSWYGYFVDKSSARNVDALYPNTDLDHVGMNFGQFCGQDTELRFSPGVTGNVTQPSLKASDSEGIAVPYNIGETTQGVSVDGTGTIATCTIGWGSHTMNGASMSARTANGLNGSGEYSQNVIREPQALANQTGDTDTFYGNIALGPNLWPFIQLYEFAQYADVTVQYNKGGITETVNLTFDQTDGTSGVSLDRAVHPQGSNVMVEIVDWQLNVDPTDEDSWTFGTISSNKTAFYQLFDENGARDSDSTVGAVALDSGLMSGTLGHNVGMLVVDTNAQGAATAVLGVQDNADQIMDGSGGISSMGGSKVPVTLTETGANTGVFRNWDSDIKSNLIINAGASRGTSATLAWDETTYSIVVGNGWGEVNMDTTSVGDEWNSGEALYVTITDEDMNLNTRSEDALSITNNATVVPAIKIGSPITLSDVRSIEIGTSKVANFTNGYWTGDVLQCSSSNSTKHGNNCVGKYNDVAYATANSGHTFAAGDDIEFIFKSNTIQTLKDLQANVNGTRNAGFMYINYDLRSLNGGTDDPDVQLGWTFGTDDSRQKLGTEVLSWGLAGNVLVETAGTSGSCLTGTVCDQAWDTVGGHQGLMITATVDNLGGSDGLTSLTAGTHYPMVVDVWTFGTINDGVNASDRSNNMIIRPELEETGVNTGVFEGTVEYIMLNQININKTSTYNATVGYTNDPVIIVMADMTDEDSVRMNYFDLGADGVETQIADQVEAPTHSGVVELNVDTYKIADTVVVTLTDMDLNTDSEIIDIYTVVNPSLSNDEADEVAGLLSTSSGAIGYKIGYGQDSTGANYSRMLDITFDDEKWNSYSAGSVTCSSAPSGDNGLYATGFTLVESGTATGVFSGDFQIPTEYCAKSGKSAGANGTVTSVTGKDIEVNYVDFRDASGEIIEVGDGAGVRGNSGSISLDRTVYPVPFGDLTAAETNTSNKKPKGSQFALHTSAVTGSYLDAATEELGMGDVVVHIRVDDPDYNVSATGEDTIAEGITSTGTRGPVKVSVTRGSTSMFLGTIGGPAASAGTIDADGTYTEAGTQEYGPMSEVSPDSGVFEYDLTVKFTDGPNSADCPTTDTWVKPGGSVNTSTETDRFNTAATNNYCILQGDIITVEYSDQRDASGNAGTATDSATFDLRNGVLQTDKSVYVIGSDMIMTLIEPDLDLDNDEAETWDLDLIEWDSDAGEGTMGDQITVGTTETSNAVFDPEPSDFRETGDSTGIFQIVIEIPNTLNGNKLDRGEVIDLEYQDWGPSGAKYVGEEKQDVNVTVYTSNFGATVELDQKVYSWTDKVYITIVAPDHNFDSGLVDKIGDTDDDPLVVQTRDGKLSSYQLAETGTDTGIFSGEVILTGFAHDADGDGTNDKDNTASNSATGPTDGKLRANDDDGLTVSYEFNEDETVVGSALIRWNIGETSWLESSYPATGTGVVRVVDPDMNWDPESVDNFKVDVWSDSDAGGISLTISETNEATGIFEGTVSFTVTDESSGHRLRVSEGDTVTAEYEDNTLPAPYTKSDDLDVYGTTMIGTIIPPLERAPAANARVVDAFGTSLAEVSVDQQVQIEADLVNGQDKDQSFAYLVQVQDESGVTVSLAWITGQLAAGQSFSPALSWIPSDSGLYTATVFVWESVDNPTALSPTVSVDINVI